MPIYPYRCKCGNAEEFIDAIKNCSKERKCSVCGKKMYRVYSFNVGDKEYAKPLHSDSLAITPAQVAEHKKHFPDIKIDDECRPIFESYKQHDNYLKKTGFVKEPQKIRNRGKKIK